MGSTPIRAQAAIEIGFKNLEGVRIGRTLAVQRDQLVVGKRIQRTTAKLSRKHRTANIARRMIDPRLQVGGAHLGPLRGRTWRAEATGGTMAHSPCNQGCDNETGKAEQLRQQTGQKPYGEDQQTDAAYAAHNEKKESQ